VHVLLLACFFLIPPDLVADCCTVPIIDVMYAIEFVFIFCLFFPSVSRSSLSCLLICGKFLPGDASQV
jgi:hypothetical protein